MMSLLRRSPVRRLSVAPLVDFEGDADKLVSAAVALTGRSHACPADALPDVFTILGWTIRTRQVPGRGYAEICPSSRTVWTCTELRGKLDHAGAEPAVRTFSLAHELAHIRWHLPALRVGQLAQRHEDEADLYAGIFLAPLSLLRETPEVRRLRGTEGNEALWALTRSLADRCRISGGAMAVRLSQLRFLQFDRVTRELKAA